MVLDSGEIAGIAIVAAAIVIGLILLIVFANTFVVVRQAEVMIIERFGKYRATLKPGLHVLAPFIDRPRTVHWRYAALEGTFSKKLVVKRVDTDRIDMREHVIDLCEQRVITKDTVAMDIDALVYYQITDAYSAVMKIDNLPDAIEMLTQSTLRNIIAHLTLDDTFSSRERISALLRERTLHDAERWGVTILRVEIMNISPPYEIKSAMEFQIREERDRRATVAVADGSRESKIIESYGQAAKLVLQAEGYKTARIQQATGESEAKMMFATAESKSMSLLSDALQGTGVRAADYLVALQYLSSMNLLTVSKKPAQVVLVPRDAVKHVAENVGRVQTDPRQHTGPATTSLLAPSLLA